MFCKSTFLHFGEGTGDGLPSFVLNHFLQQHHSLHFLVCWQNMTKSFLVVLPLMAAYPLSQAPYQESARAHNPSAPTKQKQEEYSENKWEQDTCPSEKELFDHEDQHVVLLL